MTRPSPLFLALLLLFGAGVPAPAAANPKKSTVKIFTVSKAADFYQPWQMGYQQQSTGSGLIIQGNRILTNAHVVSDEVYLQVLKAGDTRKYTAKVLHVGHDTEIAMLEVEDASFFEGTQPVTFGGLPRQRDKVAAYGFPAGGNELAITEGVVSRIEVQTYTHSQQQLLTIQTDAAINPGNSGGPVFKDGKLIGISFQSFSGSRVENTGYIIPIPIIRRFLTDVEDGNYGGIMSLGLYWQKMENEALRRHHGMEAGESGIRITRVVYQSPCWGILEEGDVLTHLDGTSIADNGTVPFRNGDRVMFANLISRFQEGDTVRIRHLRAGKPMESTLTFKPFKGLVAPPQYDVRPTYFIYSGFVFTPLTYNYMKVWRWNDVVSRFKEWFERGLPGPERGEIVFIVQVLPHGVNLGYHKLSQAVVTRVNGHAISKMSDLPPAFQDPQGGYHVLELDHHAGDSDNAATLVVLDAAATQAAHAEILKTFNIPSDRSDDLKVEEAASRD